MAHLRKRHAVRELRRLAGFWPVVGVLGLRQSGKSTLVRDLLGVGDAVTFDDEDALEDARASAKNFILKLPRPIVIDEAQKVPGVFDAIKLVVDRSRRPGAFFLTGSSEFSARLGIRESLTGRIGLTRLYPFTLAEAHALGHEEARARPLHASPARFKAEAALERLAVGGLPLPLFTRDREERERYFKGWLETSVLRDAGRVYGRGYDPDVSWSILRQMGAALREGELPSLRHFRQGARQLRRYLAALEGIFLLQRIPCHERGVGGDAWLVSDGGLARAVMGTAVGEGATLSLGRAFVLNEILAGAEYAGTPVRPTYFKSARGSPVDLVWGDALVKVSNLPKSRLSYDERPLAGALRKLGLRRGILAVPRDGSTIPRGGKGISVVPWTYWS